MATDESLKMRIDGKDSGRVSLDKVAAEVKAAPQGAENAPAVISADKSVKYESVVKVMDRLQRAGVQKVGLSVKTTG